MKFRGKINSLDVDSNAQMIDMSVTVGNKNFDVSFQMLWGDADEFDGWEELLNIVDNNRVDRQGSVMADIDAGRRELTVKYDGGEAYAYGDEAQVDVETENIPMEEKKYVNEEGQFDFKKFVAEGSLLKENYGSRHHHPGHELIHKYLDDSGVDPTNVGWEEKLRIDDIRGYEGYSEDQSALFKLIKDVDRAGGETELFLEPYDVKLETYGDDETLRIEIIDGSDAVNEDDSAFKPKRKHKQQPDKYGKGSHGKLPDFDHAMRTGDPTEYDLSDEDYNRSDRADDAAGEMGLDGAMNRARRIKHFGRRETGDSWARSRPNSDVLGKRGEKKDYRFKKDGDMYKVDKASMKSDATGKLKDLKKQSSSFRDKGRQLPESNFDKVDEVLKSLRENNK